MINVKVTFKGLGGLRRGLRRSQSRELQELVQESLFQFSNGFLLERVRLNTPILTGKLRESLTVMKPPARLRHSAVEIQSDLPYALRVHEAEFQLGSKSLEQPDQPEGGVGNKFITRVVDYHSEELKEHFGQFPEELVRKLFPSGLKRNIRGRLG